MIRAVLFDMDGVLIDSEPLSNTLKEELFFTTLGYREDGIGNKFIGSSFTSLHSYLVERGASLSLQEFTAFFFNAADRIYKTSPLSRNLDTLVATLQTQGIRMAVVSASPLPWIQTVLQRTLLQDAVGCVISLYEHPTLQGKPAPDGYLSAMTQLGVSAHETIVVEDSNKGIASGKASGAYTVGYRANLIPGYVQEGADTYIDDLLELVDIIKEK